MRSLSWPEAVTSSAVTMPPALLDDVGQLADRGAAGRQLSRTVIE